MQLILDIVTILCIGLMIGAEFTVSAFINPILQQLGDSAQAHATQLFARKLGAVMPFWYALGLLLLIAETTIVRQEPGMAFLVTASAIWAAVIVLTLMFLVPINNRIANADSGAFTDALRREHTKWDILHRGRVLALSVAMICMLLGIRL
ncbi:MAG: anthrone oxygenase family protein [Terracidiphilus sp.]